MYLFSCVFHLLQSNVFILPFILPLIFHVYSCSPSLAPQELTALFQPFSMCEDYINPPYLKAELSKCILRAMRFVHDLSDDEMKDKEVNEINSTHALAIPVSCIYTMLYV